MRGLRPLLQCSLWMLLALAPAGALFARGHRAAAAPSFPAQGMVEGAPPMESSPAPFAWGYFGVKPRMRKTYHHGYYGDYWQWTYRRGY